jgi:hypothetical protein
MFASPASFFVAGFVVVSAPRGARKLRPKKSLPLAMVNNNLQTSQSLVVVDAEEWPGLNRETVRRVREETPGIAGLSTCDLPAPSSTTTTTTPNPAVVLAHFNSAGKQTINPKP